MLDRGGRTDMHGRVYVLGKLGAVRAKKPKPPLPTRLDAEPAVVMCVVMASA